MIMRTSCKRQSILAKRPHQPVPSRPHASKPCFPYDRTRACRMIERLDVDRVWRCRASGCQSTRYCVTTHYHSMQSRTRCGASDALLTLMYGAGRSGPALGPTHVRRHLKRLAVACMIRPSTKTLTCDHARRTSHGYVAARSRRSV